MANAHKPRFAAGDKVHGHYRSATFDATVTGVAHHGTSEATTKYTLRPHHHRVSHAGSKEPATITRMGNKVEAGWVRTKYYSG